MKPTDDAGIGASLGDRLAFERLLADLSVTYANVPGNRVIEEIERGLGRLNEFLGCLRRIPAVSRTEIHNQHG